MQHHRVELNSLKDANTESHHNEDGKLNGNTCFFFGCAADGNQLEFVRSQLVRVRIKASMASEALQQHSATYAEYDPLVCPPQPSNPWLSDDLSLWILNDAL